MEAGVNGVLRSAVALLLLTSCSAAPPAAERKEAVIPASPAVTASRAPTPPPAVTLAEAGRALSEYLATEDAVRAGEDERMALKLARDAQVPLTIARYHAS